MTDTRPSNVEYAIRRTLLLNDQTEITAAAADVQLLFERCMLVVEVDEGASLADQRRILNRLTPENFQDGSDIDPAVLARIGISLRDGADPLFGAGELPEREELARAITQARLSVDPAPLGRPAGTSSLAALQLSLGLANIWRDWTGRRPTRQVRVASDTGLYSEGGEFHCFVSEMAALAPPGVRQPHKTHLPSPDHLVRQAMDELKRADAREPDPARRAFIDEATWLGKPRS